LTDQSYFCTLYEIARHLNQEFTLAAALRQALEKTVQLLDLESGWIWLVQGDEKSVYLAASYQLPSPLSDQPERLSGWCYCIDKCLSSEIKEAGNISEISCTRLRDLPLLAENIRYHATVPITVRQQTIGILNLLHKDGQQFDEKRLAVLQTISELIAMAIQRTNAQAAYLQSPQSKTAIPDVLNRLIKPGLAELEQLMQQSLTAFQQKDHTLGLDQLNIALQNIQAISQQINIIKSEIDQKARPSPSRQPLKYPNSPLTNRELEVLQFVKKGLTNRQIATHLFITERTIKFHITAILSKLDAHTRTEAVDIAIQRGLIDFG